MFYCEKCGSSDACERTNMVNEPVLCDDCYRQELNSEHDCDRCSNSYIAGDTFRCKADKCEPMYND